MRKCAVLSPNVADVRLWQFAKENAPIADRFVLLISSLLIPVDANALIPIDLTSSPKSIVDNAVQ